MKDGTMVAERIHTAGNDLRRLTERAVLEAEREELVAERGSFSPAEVLWNGVRWSAETERRVEEIDNRLAIMRMEDVLNAPATGASGGPGSTALPQPGTNTVTPSPSEQDVPARTVTAAETLSSPILTVKEAAKVARITTKRLYNLISEIKRETGRAPAFIVDGGSRLVQKIDRELFLDWIRSRRPYRGRPNRATDKQETKTDRKDGSHHGGLEG